LAHPYFDDLRDETTFKLLCKGTVIPDLFDYTREELAKESILLTKLIPKWYMKRR